MFNSPAKSACLLLIAAFLITGAECTSSQYPLSERDEGFVDPSIMGRWAEEFDFDNPAHASVDDEGNLRLVLDETVFTGYTSVVAGRRYLNLRPRGCETCNTEEQAALESQQCLYSIVQYSTEPPETINPAWATKYDEEMAQYEGRYLSIAFMANDFVEDAINKGLIAGDPDCDACVWSPGACVKAKPEVLQPFVRQFDAQLYPLENWQLYVEAPDPP